MEPATWWPLCAACVVEHHGHHSPGQQPGDVWTCVGCKPAVTIMQKAALCAEHVEELRVGTAMFP